MTEESEPTPKKKRRKRKEPGPPPKTYSVYVIELKPDVLEDKKFREANPDHDPAKACLYVGMTGLDPKERFENHKRGHRGNKYVKKHWLYLRPRLFQKYNPMTRAEAETKEVELAEELRAKGYAVWQK